MSTGPPPENLKPVRAAFKAWTGRDISPSTQARLRLSGELEMWFVLGVWCTTTEHVAAFIQRTTDKRRGLDEAAVGVPVSAERSTSTKRRLEKLGLSPPGASNDASPDDVE